MLSMSIRGVKSALCEHFAWCWEETGPLGACEGQLGAGDSAFEHDLAPEAMELGRPAAGAGGNGAGLLDQALLLDQAAEVLLVQRSAGQRLDPALQLAQREIGRHQLEHDGPVFDLGPE